MLLTFFCPYFSAFFKEVSPWLELGDFAFIILIVQIIAAAIYIPIQMVV